MNIEIEALYKQYAGLVYNRCLYLAGNHETAKDLVHDVFVQVLTKLKNFKGQSDIYTWIYRITTNICLNYLKRNAKLADREIFIDIDLSDHFKFEEQIENALSLQAMLSSLDKKCQQIVLLAFLEGLTQDEIAGVLDISRKTVYRKLKLIRKKFKESPK